MEQLLHCPRCDYDCVHLEMSISFSTDMYETTKVYIDGEAFDIQIRYGFRSQGNIHLIFSCESGCYFIKSFDGHKGNMYLNDNSLIELLEEHLNKQQKKLNKKLNGEEENLNELIDLKKECKQFFIKRAKAEEEEKKQASKIVYLNKNNNLPLF